MLQQGTLLEHYRSTIVKLSNFWLIFQSCYSVSQKFPLTNVFLAIICLSLCHKSVGARGQKNEKLKNETIFMLTTRKNVILWNFSVSGKQTWNREVELSTDINLYRTYRRWVTSRTWMDATTWVIRAERAKMKQQLKGVKDSNGQHGWRQSTIRTGSKTQVKIIRQ